MRLLDLTGKRFGSLVVIGRAPSYRTKSTLITMWVARCACGRERDVMGSNVKRGAIQTCGDAQCPFHQSAVTQWWKGDPAGHSGFKWACSLYRLQSRRRKLEFGLSISDLRQLFSGHCFYCDAPPSNVARANSKHGVFLYSGIDRVDSKAGYVPSNVRSCCWKCNCMKNVLSETDFIAHLNRIVSHLGRPQK